MSSIAQAAGSARARAAASSRPDARRDRFGGRQRQHRAEPLAARHDAVPHGLGHDGRAAEAADRGEHAIERRVDLGAARVECTRRDPSPASSRRDRPRRARRAPASARLARSAARSAARPARGGRGRTARARRRARRARAIARAQIALLERLDDGLELRERGFEVLDRSDPGWPESECFACHDAVELAFVQFHAYRVTRRDLRRLAAGCACLSAFQQTA